MYQIELVWNREFNWVRYGEPIEDKVAALQRAKALLGMGDGACVKKTRVRDMQSGDIVTHIAPETPPC